MTTSWKGPEQVSLALTVAAFSQWENFKLFGLVGPLGKRESLGSGASPQAAVARPAPGAQWHLAVNKSSRLNSSLPTSTESEVLENGS